MADTETDAVAGGAHPIYNEDGTKLIIFNGEIYNFRQLRDDLEGKGHSFMTNSNTETILHLYEEEKVKCVDHLPGVFTFAIWDQAIQAIKELFLARRYLGIKPLYNAVLDSSNIFASELKGVDATDAADKMAMRYSVERQRGADER